MMSPPPWRWYFDRLPSPVSWAKLPALAPLFRARMALAPSAPKLVPEILKTEALYGLAHCAPPMVMRKSWSLMIAGMIECEIQP